MTAEPRRRPCALPPLGDAARRRAPGFGWGSVGRDTTTARLEVGLLFFAGSSALGASALGASALGAGLASGAGSAAGAASTLGSGAGAGVSATGWEAGSGVDSGLLSTTGAASTGAGADSAGAGAGAASTGAASTGAVSAAGASTFAGRRTTARRRTTRVPAVPPSGAVASAAGAPSDGLLAFRRTTRPDRPVRCGAAESRPEDFPEAAVFPRLDVVSRSIRRFFDMSPSGMATSSMQRARRTDTATLYFRGGRRRAHECGRPQGEPC